MLVDRLSDLFAAGEGPYWHYRIPGIVVSPRGRVLAYCEARTAAGDWEPSDILMRASDDDGHTWGPVQCLASHAHYGPSCMNNPVMISDPLSGAVHLLYCHDYGRAYYRRSDDDGETFSAPVEITSTFEAWRSEYPWTVIAIGPGHGIALAGGRLLAPVWLGAALSRAHEPNRAGVIYSDDHGETWRAGALVPDTIPCCNETEAIQLGDGRVMLNMRNLGERRRRAVTVSATGAGPWAEPAYDEALPEPRCFGSLLAIPAAGGGQRVLFANPDSLTPDDAPARLAAPRVNLTLRLSEDEGRTWPLSSVIDPGPAGYADLAQARDGSVLCFYERGRVLREGGGTAALALARLDLGALHGQAGRAGTA